MSVAKATTQQTPAATRAMKQPTEDALRARIAELESALDEQRASSPAVGIVFAVGIAAGMLLAAISDLWPA